jgi:hypothetical protein
MTHKILHPSEIERATVRVDCGTKSGTAFFISTHDSHQVLITSNHNIPKDEGIGVWVEEMKVEGKVIKRFPDRDIALLSISLQNASNLSIIPLKSASIPYNEHWETYGFPAQRVSSGGRYTGTVSRINEGTRWDVDLDCQQYSNIRAFDGLSGSVLLIDGYGVGVIGYDNDGTLGATSIESLAERLIAEGIEIQTDKDHSIPSSIEADLANSTANQDVQLQINEVVTHTNGSGYYLIKGSPGSGKTTVAAQLEFTNANYIIIDRYFIKVPAGEQYSTQIRSSPEFFLNWLADIGFRALYNKPPAKSKPETTFADRIELVHQILRKLSDHLSQQRKFGFLIIDGLDDVSRSKIEEFLSCLPHQLPSNIKVIFACTSAEILPASVRGLIRPSEEVIMTPLSQPIVERFISTKLSDQRLTSGQIRELAKKTEGHPLYMRYLIKYISEEANLETIDSWIESIPVIGGDIENYYHQIWTKIENQPEEVTLAATLARLRVPVKKEKLPKLLPESSGWNFLLSYRKVQHLLKGSDLISIYHSSFSDFVKEKTKELEAQIHDCISAFTLNVRSDVFATSERIYHLANGGEDSRRKAIEECNQNWVDDCASTSIEPDIVLTDIKNTIGLAADFGFGSKVVSLLLLSQRVNFRYNSLFYDNATFLVCALLALNKPQEAIRYVVRNNALTTSDDDALYLLQRFYEGGAIEEATTLLDAIKSTCDKILEGELDSQSFSRYLHLKFSSVTLSSNADFEEAYTEYEYLKDKAIQVIEANGNSKEVIHKFKDDVGSYNIGYLIFSFGAPPTFKELDGKVKLDSKASGFIALSVYQVSEFEEKSALRRQKDSIQPWVEDLEAIIDKYGSHQDYHFFLLKALLSHSSRVDLIEKLFNDEWRLGQDVDFREENGVDLNLLSIEKYKLFSECSGFLNKDGIFPKLPKYSLSMGDWEDNLKRVFHYLFFLAGKVKRYRVENDLAGIDSIRPKFSELLNKVFPDLRDRIYWKRSYALPESLYPLIYKRLIQLAIEGFPDQLESIISSIEDLKHYQLGLYTEGYTECLFTISRELAKSQNQEALAFRTTKVLEQHILGCIENRWERNEYLLRLVELYAMLDNDERAECVFKEMIATSMGPSWYKESQLGIINTTVTNIIPAHGDHSYLKKFAGHLHEASGEMTFQRYVKQQQEELVGDLAKVGLVDKAISFLKYLVLPDHRTIIENATSGNVDKPYVGDGYILGARAIEEQSGILHLLKGIGKSDSLATWAIAELCMLGDERYLSDYTRLQADILNQFELNRAEHLDALFNRVSRFILNELDPEHLDNYLQSLLSGLSPSNQDRMKSQLPIFKRNGLDEFSNKHPGPGPTIDQAQEKGGPLQSLVKAKKAALAKLNVENKKAAREIIVGALSSAQSQRLGIWSFNYATEIEEIRDLLADAYNNSSELVKDLKSLILDEPYFEEWVIASQIINLLRNLDDESEKLAILDSVHEHLQLMIRTSESSFSRYGFIANAVSHVEPEEQLLQLLIWFLNHPSLIVKNRATELLAWLAQRTPKTVVQALIAEVLSDGYKISRELSAALLHQISSLNDPRISAELIAVYKEYEGDILGLRHFMIRDSILCSLENLCKLELDDVSQIVQKYMQSFRTTIVKSGDIVLEGSFLEPVEDLLNELNTLEILNRDFATEFFEEINKLSPLPIKDCQLASEYIDRSFNDHSDIVLVSDFKILLRHALNISVSNFVTIEKRILVANILRFYQPLFPENNLARDTSKYLEVEEVIRRIWAGDYANDPGVKNEMLPLIYIKNRYLDPHDPPDRYSCESTPAFLSKGRQKFLDKVRHLKVA